MTHAIETEPLIEVVHGNPTDEELAAVTSLLLAAAGKSFAGKSFEEQSANRKTPSAWRGHHRSGRGVPQPGPGVWKRSAH